MSIEFRGARYDCDTCSSRFGQWYPHTTARGSLGVYRCIACERKRKDEQEKKLLCKHLDFKANVSVNRLEDTGRFMADIIISCAGCGEPFHFNGIQNFGVNTEGAALSPDGLELRINVAPGIGGMMNKQS